MSRFESKSTDHYSSHYPDNIVHITYKVVFMIWDDEGENFDHDSDFVTIENEQSDEDLKWMAAKELNIEVEDIIEIIKH